MSDSDFFAPAQHVDEALERQKADLERTRKLQEDQRKQKIEDAKNKAAAEIEAGKREHARKELQSFYQQSVEQFHQAASNSGSNDSQSHGPLFKVNAPLSGGRYGNVSSGKSSSPADSGGSLFAKYAPKPKG